MTGPVPNSKIHDQLFGNLSITGALLYRKVEVCHPERIGASPHSRDNTGVPWVEEEKIIWLKSHPSHLTSSKNFSIQMRIHGLTVSSQLLWECVWSMERHVLRTAAPESIPTDYTLQHGGVFFSSATKPISERIKRVRSGEFFSMDDWFRHMSISIFGGIPFGPDFAPIRFGGGAMTEGDAFRHIQRNCAPGDIRVRHFVFTPQTVTLVAYKRGETLEPRKVDSVRIGAVVPGRVALDEVFEPLLQQYESDIVPQKAVIAIGWIAFVFLMVPDPRRRCVSFIALACVVGLLRSLIVQSGFFHPVFWIGLGILVAFLKNV
jgi:hypothetical protein